MIKQFFQDVFGDNTGRAVIVLPNYSNKPTRDHWFSYPEQLDDMVALVDANKTKSVWYSPFLYASDERTKNNSIVAQVYAADADTCEPDSFRIRPSWTVETSPGRYQVYWKLNEAQTGHEPVVEVAKVNRRIAQAHKSQGCDTAFVNSAKLLRVPGTSNHKHPGAVVILADIDDYTYSVGAFEEVYPVSETPDAIDYEQIDMPDEIATFALDQGNRMKLMQGLPNSQALRSLMMDRWAPDKRSDMRYKLLCELYRLDLGDDAVMAIAWWAPSNKYTEDPRGVRGLWAEAMKAKAEIAQEVDAYDKPIGDKEGWEHEVTSQVEVRERTDFLTSEERETLPVSFVDEWVQWAGTKTDAPAEYHRAAAVTLLSAVYSEFGHAFPAFGELKLNIWMMVLGRSTKDRKSTSRGYLSKAFRALRTDEYNYDLGDDVTPSGISLALHDRANKATVFSRDEVQGLFKELLHQSYMSGGLEVFTKLYDGWSGGRVRATGEKKVLDSVPVSFLMFLMGILTESAEVLTVTNYRSGFLTRFVYVIGSRPEGYEPPPLEQGKRTEGGSQDPVFDGMMNHLITNRAWWELRGGDGQTFELVVEDDAWTRFQEFMVEASRAADDSPYAEVIGTTTERMQITVLKLATIFAMDDRATKVKMQHMLQAIGFAGEWFDNAVTVASMVSESEWQRDVDKLEAYINQKGGKISYAMAYRAFKDKRAFEFEEMVVALERRGVLNRIQNGSRWTLEIEYHE